MYLSKNLNIRFFCLFAFCLFLKELMHTYAHTIYIYLIKNTAKKCNIMINFLILTYFIAVMANIFFYFLFLFVRCIILGCIKLIKVIYIYIRMISEC